MRKASSKARMYAVDQDFPKEILRHAGVVWWRLSPSRKGFHFRWYCPKRSCKACREWKARLDDPKRQERDLVRPVHARNVLWERKGTRRAGPWHQVTNRAHIRRLRDRREQDDERNQRQSGAIPAPNSR